MRKRMNEWVEKRWVKIKEKLWNHFLILYLILTNHCTLTGARTVDHNRTNTFYISENGKSFSYNTFHLYFLFIFALLLFYFLPSFSSIGYVHRDSLHFLRIGCDGFVMVSMNVCVCGCTCIWLCVWRNIQLSIFLLRFFSEGPGAVGIDMDDGIKLMERYSDQFKLLSQQRHEFGNEQHTYALAAPPILVSTITIPKWMWQNKNARAKRCEQKKAEK